LNTLAAITAKKAGFKSLGDTWADTTTSHGRLMLTVLGGLAEFERDLIRARTGDISGENGGRSTLDAFRGQSCAPQPRGPNKSSALERHSNGKTRGPACTFGKVTHLFTYARQFCVGASCP
jgi:hypothetical protein